MSNKKPYAQFDELLAELNQQALQQTVEPAFVASHHQGQYRIGIQHGNIVYETTHRPAPANPATESQKPPLDLKLANDYPPDTKQAAQALLKLDQQSLSWLSNPVIAEPPSPLAKPKISKIKTTTYRGQTIVKEDNDAHSPTTTTKTGKKRYYRGQLIRE
ncbi:MAG: hypothetical protein ACWA5U_01635 [bacterium]